MTRGVWLSISIRPGSVTLARSFHRPGIVDGDAARFQPVDHRQGQAAIDRLVLANQWHGKVLEFAVGRRQTNAVVRPEHPARFEAVAEFDRLAGDIQRHADLLGHLLQRGLGIRVLHDADGRERRA